MKLSAWRNNNSGTSTSEYWLRNSMVLGLARLDEAQRTARWLVIAVVGGGGVLVEGAVLSYAISHNCILLSLSSDDNDDAEEVSVRKTVGQVRTNIKTECIRLFEPQARRQTRRCEAYNGNGNGKNE